MSEASPAVGRSLLAVPLAGGRRGSRQSAAPSPRDKVVSAEELEKLGDIFNEVCTEDKEIDIDGLLQLMRKLGNNPTKKELEVLMQAADKDGSGTIDYQEFLSWFPEWKAIEISDEERRQYKEIFEEMDVDKSGYLDMEELAQVMQRLARVGDGEHYIGNVSKIELEVMMKVADEDGNGHIEFDEFCMMMVHRREERLAYQRAFELVDTDGSGTIDKDELRVLLRNLHMEPSNFELDVLAADADLNGDGVVDFGEMCVMMTKLKAGAVFKVQFGANALEPQEKQFYREIFDNYDIDGGGTIDVAEMATLMRDCGHNLSKVELDMLLAEADKDGNGEVDFDEFCSLMLSLKVPDFTEEELADAFEQWDADGDGTLSVEELTKCIPSSVIPDNFEAAILDMVHVAGSEGGLDFKTFKKWVTQ